MAQSSQSPALHDLSGLGNLSGARIAIISTEWNDAIIAELIGGAEKIFLSQQNAVISQSIKVPGAIEIPFACKLVSEISKNKPEAIIAFGAVIRGGTPHFEYVCKSVTEGITQLNVTGIIPIIFGVLTLDNEAQAWERLGGTHGHKGEEAAIAALKMIGLCRIMRSEKCV